MKKIMRILGFLLMTVSLSAFASEKGKEKEVKSSEQLQLPNDIVQALNPYGKKTKKANLGVIIKFLQENPTYVNASFGSFKNKTNLLSYVASRNDTPLVEYLLKNKANVGVVDDQGNTPLLLSFRPFQYPSQETVKLLLDAGSNVNARNLAGETPLMEATAAAPDVMKLLLSKKADANAQDNYGNTPLIHLVSNKSNFYEYGANLGPIVKDFKQKILQLIQHGADPTVTNNKNKNMFDVFLHSLGNEFPDYLLYKDESRLPSEIRPLIQYIRDIMQQYSEKHEMEIATSSSLPPELRGLIGEHEIGPRGEQQRRFNNVTQLIREFKEKDSFWVALKNEIEVPKDLENPKFSDELGYTLFHIAANQCAKEALEVLINEIKDINKLDRLFARKPGIQTPLELAQARYEAEKTDPDKENQCKATVDLLQKYKVGEKANAQKSKASTQDITAIFDAVAGKAKGAGKDLIDYIRAGKDVNLKELESGKTLLMHAVQANNREAVAELLRANADTNVVDDKENTALIYAVEQGDPDIVQMLLARMTPDAIRKVNKAGENALSLAELELAKGMGTLEGERKKITGHQSEITEQQPDQKVKKFEFSKATAEQKKALAEKMALGVEIDKLSSIERRYLEIVKMLQKYEKAK